MNDPSIFFASFFGGGVGFFILITFLVWVTVWKGIALWKSARLSQKRWFIALLIIHTAGLLEIIYIFFVARKKEQQKEESNTTIE